MDDFQLLVNFHIENERQGPGGITETKRALQLAGLNKSDEFKVADLGCGTADKPDTSVGCIGRMHNQYQITKWALDGIIQNVKNFDIKPDNASASKTLQAKSIITKHGRECAQSAIEALGGYSYYKKVGIERLYRDLLAGEFHPMQSCKQEVAQGNYLLGSSFVG